MIEVKSDMEVTNIKIQAHGREEIVQNTVNILHGIYNSVKAAVGPEEAETFFAMVLDTIKQNIDVFINDSSDSEIVVVEDETK